MNQTLRRFVNSTVATVTALGVSTLGLAGTTYANQLTHNQVTLNNTDTAHTAVTYDFRFTAASALGNVGKIILTFTTTASGTTAPTGFSSSSAAVASANVNGGSSEAKFTGGTVTATANTITLVATSAVAVTAGQYVDIAFNGIVNPTNPESDYVQIQTFNDTAGTQPADTGTTSFTVVTPIVVSAVVDPYMTFTVAGVVSNFAVNDTDLSGNGGTAVTTTTGTAIPFGNIQVGSKKYAQQSLSVRTNAGNGYNVYQKFTTAQVSGSDTVLNGTGVNKIDTFTASSATFGSPQTWASPTGSAANVSSAWVGMRTTGASAFVGANKWAPPATVSTATGSIVKTSTGPDNGQSNTTTYVTYQIEANAFQPSDSYSGTMQYNVVAPY